MLPKRLNELQPADFTGLIGTPEGRTLEFKMQAVGSRDDDKREFLADASSLANAQGGDLVFGIAESQGVAVDAPGIELTDVDAERLRLENILRDGLEPRLAGVDTHWVATEGARGFLVLRVRPSFAAPHRVRFRDHAKFYGRNSAGKYPMDVHELRTAFTAQEGLERRLREIQGNAETMALDPDGPILSVPGPLLIVSYVPLSSLYSRYDLEVDASRALKPTDSHGFSGFPTLDGFLQHTQRDDGKALTYAITFRSGYTTSVMRLAAVEGKLQIWAGFIESRILTTCQEARAILSMHGLDGPAAVCVSMVRVRDYTLYIGELQSDRPALKRDVLTLPVTVVDDPTEDALLPLCARTWNAFGYARPQSRRLGHM